MKPLRVLALLLLITPYCSAQTAPAADIATIEQNLRKLDVLGSVLYVAAHPDDENNRLLAYLAQEKHYRTGYLSMTRGDGGQNLIGNEQGDLLGLIRTQELLAARKVDGAEQFFTRANDFGFSKGPEETLTFWGKEKTLGDVVWVIRKFRPDVIICRFPTTGEGGHGNHTASAILAQEAFTAAADPKRFPEQLKYVQTWQAKRLLWNTFSFGSINTTSADQFKINVGVYNPILGKEYGELAAESRSNHKTQGFGSAKQRGDAYEYFKTILGDAPKNDLFDGVNTTWTRVEGGEQLDAEAINIRRNFSIDSPATAVPALVKMLDKVENTGDSYWREQKTRELDNLIADCAGLWFEAYAMAPAYALGDSIPVLAQFIERYKGQVMLKSVVINGVSKSFNGQGLSVNQLRTEELRAYAARITQPYWLETSHGIGSYNIPDLLSVGNPENTDSLNVDFVFLINGKTIHFQRKLVYKYVDPAKGELYQPVIIAPPVTATMVNQDYIFNNSQSQSVQVKLKSFTKSTGSISLQPVSGWKISPDKMGFAGKNKGDEWTVNFMVTPADSQQRRSVLKAVVTANGKPFSMGFKQITYEHIPTITLFPPAVTKLININLKLAGKKIGYIPGAGDFVQDALKQVGYDIHPLTEPEILNGDLSVYDAIVTGVRAFNVNPRLAVEEPKLLEYVKNGGNLVVQYNTSSGLVTHGIGPYPFAIVNKRVTDEEARVTVTGKGSPVLNYPNKITQDDFNNWIQERGLYFVNDIDPRYQAPLEMNDPGETANNGSLIVGDYGKGRFVYTSLAFFRQLPAGVPGAYRLFVNLLSKPKGK